MLEAIKQKILKSMRTGIITWHILWRSCFCLLPMQDIHENRVLFYFLFVPIPHLQFTLLRPNR